MSEPFLAEVRIFGFNFPPRGWAFCDGQILPISQNQALYSLLGTTYGGDGRTVFALPDLRGRVPRHVGDGVTWGEPGGEVNHTLTTDELPAHSHGRGSNDPATSPDPTGRVPARARRRGGLVTFTAPPANVELEGDEVAGSGQAHANMQPYLALRFAIALSGLFPSRN